MQVGIVINNNLNRQSNGITSMSQFKQSSNIHDSFNFSGRRSSPVSQTESQKIKTILKEIFSRSSKLLQETVLQTANKKFFTDITAALKSKQVGLEVKKCIIETLFQRAAHEEPNLPMYSDYIHRGLVPHIVKTKDEVLAQHVLELTKISDDSSGSAIIARTQFIAALGNEKQHMAELKSYMGNQVGIPQSVKRSEAYERGHLDSLISNWAFDAIRKLERSPDLKTNSGSRIELYRKSLRPQYQD